MTSNPGLASSKFKLMVKDIRPVFVRLEKGEIRPTKGPNILKPDKEVPSTSGTAKTMDDLSGRGNIETDAADTEEYDSDLEKEDVFSTKRKRGRPETTGEYRIKKARCSRS